MEVAYSENGTITGSGPNRGFRVMKNGDTIPDDLQESFDQENCRYR